MGAAFEVNKQMCDLERGLSNDFLGIKVRIVDKLAKDVIEGVKTPDWAKNMLAGIPEQLSRAEYEILDEILKEKNRFMEEKKTKKITKAEAFEYLKGKKVKCYKVGEHYGEKLLKKLTECGCTSNIFLPKGILSVWAIFISDACDLSILDTAHADQYGNYDLFEIAADDILSIEIVEGTPKFSYEKVVELAKPLMQYLLETGHTEVISVCIEGISAIPMGTFLYKG